MRLNPILLTDSYKFTHWGQYPKGTTSVYSYLESRGGQFSETVFFGLQIILKRFLLERITQQDVDEAAAFITAHLGNEKLFNRAGFERIVNVHGGRWPVRIRAVPEGMVVGPHNVLMTLENTDPELPWVTNYLETLVHQVWYAITVATKSREMKKLIHASLVKTGTPEAIGFKLHDFGFRGVSSVESAGIGGAAHLVNFLGTDTVAGLLYAREYYDEPMAGFSIPAAEHSTITSWGRDQGEVEAYRNMIRQYGEGAPGLYAVVSDSYDLFHAIHNVWGGPLKGEVLAAGNVLVVRPDSGVPHQIVPDTLAALGAVFGYTVNEKSYKVLNNKIRVIQGDGIDYEETQRILANTEAFKWSTDNLAFGMGGGLLQKVDRDTMRFAFKCSSVVVDGVERDVRKTPVTDMSKRSKAGRLRLIDTPEGKKTVRQNEWIEGKDLLIDVYLDGQLLVDHRFADIRSRASL